MQLTERAVTSSGTWRGVQHGGVASWLGVRYASPPTGALRFRPAQPPSPLSGETVADHFGPAPIQATPDNEAARLLGAPVGEDCLRLNIWAPAHAHDCAVLLWIHGGGYVGGSASQLDFDGARLAASQNIVVSTVGYRTGALGYLDLRDILPDAAPTPGLTDQIQALRWLRENIAAFGGDPGRITIAGQSAGANAVATLMAVPEVRGYFRTAIAQSAPLTAAHDPANSRMWGTRFAAGLSAGARDLRSAPATVLAAAIGPFAERIAAESAGTLATAPVIDGEILPTHPLEALQSGSAAPVPLLIGTNRHEAAGLRGSLALRLDREDLLRWFPTAERTEPHLPGAYPGWPDETAVDDLGTDLWFRLPSQAGALGHSTVAPTWSYEFRYEPRGVGAARHGIEAGFLFGNTDRGMWRWLAPGGPNPNDAAMVALVQARWGAMVRDADPGVGWPRFDARRSTMVLDMPAWVEEDPRRAARQAVSAAGRI